MTAVAEKIRVMGSRWSVVRTVKEYDPDDPIWDYSHNANFQLVAEMHTCMVVNLPCYAEFEQRLGAFSQTEDFIATLVLAIPTLVDPLKLREVLITAGVAWSTQNHWKWEEGFGPTRDFLYTNLGHRRRDLLDEVLVAAYESQISKGIRST